MRMTSGRALYNSARSPQVTRNVHFTTEHPAAAPPRAGPVMGSEGEKMMVLFLLACLVSDEEVKRALDPDGDGVGPKDDCGPMDPTVYPGAVEVWYDRVDQDCSRGSDYDQDGDGFASAMHVGEDWLVGTDCDDEDWTVYPDAEEACGDGVVNNCDADPVSTAAQCLRGSYSLSTSTVVYEGPQNSAHLGISLAGGVDVSGDGVGDLLIAAPRQREECGDGVVYLVHTPSSFSDELEMQDAKEISHVTFCSDTYVNDDELYVGLLQDFTDDALGEALIIFRGAYIEQTTWNYTGAVYLFYSDGQLQENRGEIMFGSAEVTLTAEWGNHVIHDATSFGTFVAGDRSGVATVYGGTASGSDATVSFLTTQTLLDGGSLIFADDSDLRVRLPRPLGEDTPLNIEDGGDIDGDGLPDVIVGDADSDSVYILLSTESLGLMTGGEVSGADLSIVGDANTELGVAVTVMDDIDGDERSEVFVSTTLHEGDYRFGAVYLMLSTGALANPRGVIDPRTADVTFVENRHMTYFGSAISAASDLDGDGIGDLVVGAPGDYEAGSFAGAVYGFMSSSYLDPSRDEFSSSEADIRLFGETSRHMAGSVVIGVDDITGDTVPDILVGAPYYDLQKDSAGAAYVWSGTRY